MTERLLTMAQLSERIATPVATLRFWRHKNTGPKSFLLGGRVVYTESDVAAWIDSQYAAANSVRGGVAP